MRAENFDGEKVAIHLLEPPVQAVLPLVDLIHMGVCGRDAIITSAKDRTHSSRSLHYLGLAFDVRTSDISPEDMIKLCNELRRQLPDSWDVVPEQTHCHIEYAPKR